MRFFALETDRNVIIDRYCSPNECVLSITRYHGILFAMRIFKEVIISIFLAAILFGAYVLGIPLGGVAIAAGITFFLFVFIPSAKAYLDWQYDFMFTTTDKIVLIDQTSIFKQEIRPLHIENIGSISVETQWLGLFNFGKIIIQLKEGQGGAEIIKPYVPNPEKITEIMSHAVTEYQRGQYTSQPPADRPYVSTSEVDAQLDRMEQRFETQVKPAYESKKRNQE